MKTTSLYITLDKSCSLLDWISIFFFYFIFLFYPFRNFGHNSYIYSIFNHSLLKIWNFINLGQWWLLTYPTQYTFFSSRILVNISGAWSNTDCALHFGKTPDFCFLQQEYAFLVLFMPVWFFTFAFLWVLLLHLIH